jgi:hypothetical protein
VNRYERKFAKDIVLKLNDVITDVDLNSKKYLFVANKLLTNFN